ncbi:hypothetical protein AA0119_g1646 [Alternaria tenuissima]|uniref:Mitochondrial outer membrane translocase complex, subunit Tom5 n=1 Tax=Alternaria tenuissima TaxID=119927 RepID=A0AB37W0L7_9PLEO|nr:hypothetical protein AA0115_g11821 [Alternaria tenuissima]RYN96063.1 hypothetical protein AA0120_g3052 [Alternaria tenuissima]RYO08073.1 hypothetical protein AA0119_g1646 [Alternaria tenuissima]RYO23515.1 hypothetical protein AA0121_g1746 [Alternaria tenuissima]
MTEESQIMILTCMTAPPQPSKQELAAAEAQTMTDIKWTAASAVVLYFSPHLVEYVSKLF